MRSHSHTKIRRYELGEYELTQEAIENGFKLNPAIKKGDVSMSENQGEYSIVQQPSPGLPVITIQEAVSRYNQVVEFTKKVMKAGTDYGVIPGTGKTPTLKKPGAEKLCTLFGLVPRFRIIDKIVDFDAGMFYYHYACDLYRGENLVGSGEGSCNNHEKKYRYRNIPEWKATDAEKTTAIRVEQKTSKQGTQYNLYTIENPSPADQANTILKMAQKRAFVAAVLVATNASEFYTQDLEDGYIGDYVEGDYREVQAQTQQDPKPKAKPNGNGESKPNGKYAHIYTAVVKEGYSSNEYAAASALSKCKTGWDTEDKAVAWMKLYRAWRDSDLPADKAADKANAGEAPK
jgi:hypothetical protein